jgi:outer membrane protein TolC
MKRMVVLTPVLLAACAVGPTYRRPVSLPQQQTALHEAVDNNAVVASPLPPRWWVLFQDAELDRLVTQALARNTDLRVAAANLRRARALLSQAGAATRGLQRSPNSGRNSVFSSDCRFAPRRNRRAHDTDVRARKSELVWNAPSRVTI